jgi:hypothetical protein
METRRKDKEGEESDSVKVANQTGQDRTVKKGRLREGLLLLVHSRNRLFNRTL